MSPWERAVGRAGGKSTLRRVKSAAALSAPPLLPWGTSRPFLMRVWGRVAVPGDRIAAVLVAERVAAGVLVGVGRTQESAALPPPLLCSRLPPNPRSLQSQRGEVSLTTTMRTKETMSSNKCVKKKTKNSPPPRTPPPWVPRQPHSLLLPVVFSSRQAQPGRSAPLLQSTFYSPVLSGSLSCCQRQS